jgi:hypothetical protein
MKKKIIYFITIISFTCLGAKAQEDKIYGGFKVAPNYSLITDKADKWKSGIGYSIGYFEVAELTYKMNLQAEINYSVYSFNNEVLDGFDNNGNEKTTKKNKTHKSIEIPIMAKYRVSDQFAIGLGYQVSLRTKVKDETGSNDLFGSADNNDNEAFSLSSLFSPKHSTSGFFVDASYKSEKVICGLRLLQTNKQLIDETHKSINASFYVGFPLF